MQQKTKLNKSKNATLNTVLKPECLYAKECLILNCKEEFKEFEKIRTEKNTKKDSWPKKNGGEWKKRNDKELYLETEKRLDTIWKRRVVFYGHLVQMNPARLTKRIFDHFDKNFRMTGSLALKRI